jgi:hypothetical protein
MTTQTQVVMTTISNINPKVNNEISKEKRRIYQATYRAKHKDRLRKYDTKIMQVWRENNHEYNNLLNKEHQRRHQAFKREAKIFLNILLCDCE